MNQQFEIMHPPEKLADGFLEFAKSIHQKTIDRGAKFTEEEMSEIFNNSFPGISRANILFWVADVNKYIKTVNLILSDLEDIKNDKNTLKGEPVIRSEFLFQSFFGEFFKMREIAKLYLKFFKNLKLLNNVNKEEFYNFYQLAFDWVYKIRNQFIHLGMEMKNFDVDFDIEILNEFPEEDRIKFIKAFNESNTRENTVEFQCAIYIKIIKHIMKNYIDLQILVNETLADLIISFEKYNLEITITENK
ncbi:hypothetical protein SAMN05421786_1011109 [Chryseobacterium ureilyticum]|uniref:Uncharacterized protein n=1 Tax=Chryseobacterium ureilyticum TaxID=373668 RepID=A0A1N7L939_9FLAO|nr:hypothetical protein [Chryseobacterium ureilyticum]SIS70317.1 hypothetical protein SAMN05421786_1011109 [Chryseobacterium ureilyticum]